MLFKKSTELPGEQNCLPGRPQPMQVSGTHLFSARRYLPPFPEGYQKVFFGLGCFWGAERLFWEHPQVYVTAVGYAGGATPNPTYEEVCSGRTGHAEVVMVVYPEGAAQLAMLLRLFWESHDPTQGMRQGNDRGTQYRSAIYVNDEASLDMAQQSRDHYADQLSQNGKGRITTEIKMNQEFYYAEEYHQQYLIRVPNGYCGLAGTGVSYGA